jgi:hypothetical protein
MGFGGSLHEDSPEACYCKDYGPQSLYEIVHLDEINKIIYDRQKLEINEKMVELADWVIRKGIVYRNEDDTTEDEKMNGEKKNLNFLDCPTIALI